MDASVEVTIARQYGRRIEIAVDDLLLDFRIERTRHAVASGAGKRNDAKTELLEFRFQTGFFEVQRDGLGARRERTLHPRLARQTETIGVARQQRRRNHVTWIRSIGATGDGRDDHRAIGHEARLLLPLTGDALGGEIGSRHPRMGITGAGHGAHHARQVEAQSPLVDRSLQTVGPQTCLPGISLDQFDLLAAAAGEGEIVQGLLVDREHRRRGAIFRRHIGNRRAVAKRQRRRAGAMELEIGTDHLGLA